MIIKTLVELRRQGNEWFVYECKMTDELFHEKTYELDKYLMLMDINFRTCGFDLFKELLYAYTFDEELYFIGFYRATRGHVERRCKHDERTYLGEVKQRNKYIKKLYRKYYERRPK